MKKIGVLLLLLAILLSLCPSALATIGDNLITNSDFETVSGAQATGWSATAAGGNTVTWGNEISVTTEKCVSASHSLKITTMTAGLNPTATQTKYTLLGQTQYTMSARVYLDALAGTQPSAALKIDMYTSARVSIGSRGTSQSTVTNGWTQISTTFVTGEDCGIGTLQVRLIGTGTVYFDDVKLVQDSEPQFGIFETDQIFYYTEKEAENGFLSLRINSAYDSVLTGAQATFTIAEGSTQLFTQTVPVESRAATVAFPIRTLAETKTEYCAAVTVTSSGGTPLFTEQQLIYKYNRPNYIAADGTYLLNGTTPFDPLFAYHVSTADYPQCAAMGINVVQSGLTKNLTTLGTVLDTALQNNLRVLVTLYNDMQPAGHVNNISYTLQAINTYKNHRAVFAWAIMDEPFLNRGDIGDDLRKSYIAIRERDDNHPVYLVEGSGAHYGTAAKYADIFAVDPYLAYANTPLTTVTNAVTKACAVAKTGGRPVYALLQTYRQNGFLPDGSTVRNMAYRALQSGARAVGWFSYSDADKDASNNRIAMHALPSAAAVTYFGTQEKQDAYDIFVRGMYQPQTYTIGDFSITDYEKDGTRHRLILNLTKSAQEEAVPTIGVKCAADVDYLWSDGMTSATYGGNSITYTLADSAAVRLIMNNTEYAFIDNYSVTSGSVLAVETPMYGNNAEKLCFTATADTPAIAEGVLFADTLAPSEHYEITATFAISDFTAGSGARMTVFRRDPTGNETVIGQTDYFTRTTDFLRKMMVATTEDMRGSLFVRIELQGTATAYITSVEATRVPYYVNGDFEGLTADGVPLGWTFLQNGNIATYGTVPSRNGFITDISDTTTDGMRLVETTDGNYVYCYNKTRASMLTQTISRDALTDGALYGVTVSHKSNSNGVGFYTATGCTTPKTLGDGTFATWTKSSADWEDKSLFVKCTDTGDFSVGFRVHNAGDKKWYMDNVRMKEFGGNTAFSAENGTITAETILPETLTAASIQIISALYTYIDDVKTLMDIDVAMVSPNGTVLPTGVPTTSVAAVGCVSAYTKQTFSANSGSYEVNTLIWQPNMLPYYEKAVFHL